MTPCDQNPPNQDSRNQELKNRCVALQAEANYYRRIEFAKARESNLEYWLAVLQERWNRA